MQVGDEALGHRPDSALSFIVRRHSGWVQLSENAAAADRLSSSRLCLCRKRTGSMPSVSRGGAAVRSTKRIPSWKGTKEKTARGKERRFSIMWLIIKSTQVSCLKECYSEGYSILGMTLSLKKGLFLGYSSLILRFSFVSVLFWGQALKFDPGK